MLKDASWGKILIVSSNLANMMGQKPYVEPIYNKINPPTLQI